MVKYRGKYPTRINAVYSVNGGKGIRVQLNNGFRYDVIPLNSEGRKVMPRPGQDIEAFNNLNYALETVGKA